MRIVWSPLVVQRMEEISDYIAYDKPTAAQEWVRTVFDKVSLLKTSPDMGRVVPELGIANIRELIVGNYRVIYRHTGKEITLLTVRSFKQMLDEKEIG